MRKNIKCLVKWETGRTASWEAGEKGITAGEEKCNKGRGKERGERRREIQLRAKKI